MTLWSAAPSAAAAILLVIVAIEDLRRFRIRNVLVLGLLACFALDTVLGHRAGALVAHLLFGGAGFLVLLAAFARGWIGGGDAKLLSAALLWVGPAGAVPFSLLLGIATVTYALGARLGRFPARRRGARLSIPFGPSIAVAWLITLCLTVI